MPVATNYSGRTFGRITLSAPVPGKSGYWKGTCSCGNPVEKRLDNLKRPGDHSCGKCLAPAHTTDANLGERVRRLELIHCTLNHRIIADAELTLSEERREEIRYEVSQGL